MKPPVDAGKTCELPWLCPCADSLVALARGTGAPAWSALRTDPGLVVLLLRAAGPAGRSSALPFYTALLHEPAALSLAAERLGQRPAGFVNWSGASAKIYRTCQILARTAEAIALRSDRSDPHHAFVAGLLAPLGWLAAAAVDVESTEALLRELAASEVAGKSPQRLWGFDAPAIARRLARHWMLPDWLATVVGHLALPADVAATLGADPDRFRIVQLAALLVEQADWGLGLQVGSSSTELTAALDLPAAAVEAIRAELPQFARESSPPVSWSSPWSVALLPDLVRLALENRRSANLATQQRLHAEVDALHNAVARQHAVAQSTLQEHKLRAMAELAAGAGHEINNPLAVISGQAQYLQCSELEPGRRKALQTIVGQTQRIHQVLTGLMQFARPQSPQKQAVDLGGLVGEVIGGLQGLADERQVQLQVPETLPLLTLLVDAGQMRTVLTALVRNAIEAALPAGWARLHLDRTAEGGLTFVIEDNGPGPNVHDREHLFDPFYSGRKAGRGRGLGLPTAWQLARLHNGEVRFDGTEPTRFVLELPATAVCAPSSEDRGSRIEDRANLDPRSSILDPRLPGGSDSASSPGLPLPRANGNGIAALG
jgi:two-component system NtrC family sensor kinase